MNIRLDTIEERFGSKDNFFNNILSKCKFDEEATNEICELLKDSEPLIFIYRGPYLLSIKDNITKEIYIIHM